MIPIFPSGFWSAIQHHTRCNWKVRRLVFSTFIVLHEILWQHCTVDPPNVSVAILKFFSQTSSIYLLPGYRLQPRRLEIRLTQLSDFSKINVEAFFFLIIQCVGQIWMLHFTDRAAHRESLVKSMETFEGRWLQGQNRSCACPEQRNFT